MFVYNNDKYKQTTIVVDARDFMLDKEYRFLVQKFIENLGINQGIRSQEELKKFETKWFVDGSYYWYPDKNWTFRLVSSIMLEKGIIEP